MQGTLRDFRLAEILQLVAVQQKTGLLRVESHGMLLTFYFDNGMLVSCRDRRRLATDPLLDYLGQYGFLDASRVSKLKDELDGSKRDLVEVVLERNLVSEDDIEIALDDLAQELVYRTYNWNDGAYRFISGDEALQGLTHTISRQVEGLLMEAARRSDEWPRLLEKLPGDDVLVDAITGSTEGLDERTLSILNRLSEPRRMGELVAESRVPEYDLYETVAAALEAGMTTVLEVPEKKDVRTTAFGGGVSQGKGRFKERRQLPGVLFWILAVWVFVSVLGGAHLLSTQFVDRRDTMLTTVLAVERARASIHHSLEVYRAIHGHFPSHLEALTASAFASPELLSQARLTSYTVAPDGSSYRLFLAELDG